MRPSARRKLENGSLRILPFDEIDRKVESGEYQFHSFGTCWVWTQVTQYETEKILEVVLLLGSGFEEEKERISGHLVEFGKKHGCDAVETMCRLGFEPCLKSLGWKRKRILLRKEI